MSKRVFFLISVFLCAIFCTTLVYAKLEFPKPTGFVNDFENIIDNDEELEEKLNNFEKETSIEIAVVTIKDFADTTIEDYASRLFEEWGIGKDEHDNGVLVLISSRMRESRIEVGYGLEGALPDGLTGRIQDDEMIPFFREDDYSQGINNGIDAIISATKGEYENEEVESEFDPSIIYFIIFIIVIIMVLSGKFPLLSMIFRILLFSSRFSSSSSSSSGGGKGVSFGGFGGGRSGGGGSSRSW